MEDISRSELRAQKRRIGRWGFVYFMSDGDLVKIGWSVSPEHRRKDLRSERKKEIAIIATFRAARYDEYSLHQHLRHLRVEGEWFRPSPEIDETIAALRAGDVFARDLQEILIDHLNAKNRIKHPRDAVAEVERLIMAERIARKTVRLEIVKAS